MMMAPQPRRDLAATPRSLAATSQSAGLVCSQACACRAPPQLLTLLRKHCVEKACPIAGFSIQCDREVLQREMPETYSFLNHRIVDVSSFTGMMERWLPDALAAWKEAQAQGPSNYNHRAMNDVESSIQTMHWVRRNLLVQPSAAEAEEPK